jgi:two-component system, cell cycle sensor histidine kinase and response regulator CckA
MPRILIADDNAENLYFMEVLLKGHQFDVTTAENGSQALEAALASPPDAIVTDILMPVMDGFALCREWKSNEKLNKIPFVFYTATYTEPKDEEFALSLGADRFVIKPAEPDTLIQIINDVIATAHTVPASVDGSREENRFLREYNEALFHKLEKKMSDLEQSNTALLMNITELQKAQKALKASEVKYRAIFENAVMGIFQITREGRYLNANRAFAGMLGFNSPEEMMRAIPDMREGQHVNLEDWRRFRSALAEGGLIEGFETQLWRADRDEVWISMNMRATRDKAGSILQWEGTAEDITLRKKAEDEKTRLESQLRQSQKMEAIGTLAGGIAHDFNNILTAIIGYASLLQMDMQKTDPKRIYIDQILSSGQKAANLTQSLLAFSRKQVMELKALKMKTVLKEMEKMLPRLLTEDIDLKIEPIDDRLTIMADLTQIDQVLLNLATNARDAMPKGGRLIIEAREVWIDDGLAEDRGLAAGGNYVLLSVTDTGAGMNAKTKEKIFEPFFTTKEAGKGTGLGLSTVYGIVKQHDGYIGVDSAPDRGTTFMIYLPSAKARAVEVIEADKDLAYGTETILVAEDNTDLRILMKDVLSRGGYTVIDAVDGEDAIQRFTEHKDSIDLLILDVVMPRKNGKAVAEEIRKIRPGAKVLFTSGYTGDVVLDKGIHNEAVDFLKKPLPPEEMLRKIREVLDR